MDVNGPCVELDLFEIRQAIEIGVGGRRGFANGAELPRLFERALSPTAGENVVGALAFGQQVHRNHRELQACASLKEENLVVLRNAEHSAQIGLGLLDD